MSLEAVNIPGTDMDPGYTREAARSSEWYITESIEEGSVTGRVIGSGTIEMAGSSMRRPISRRKVGKSSSGRARMSMVASAVDGMTLGPIPACSIVGTTEVRNTE